MLTTYTPADVTTSTIVGCPEQIDRLANQLKFEIRQNVITFLSHHFQFSCLDFFATRPGLEARPSISLSTAEDLLKIALSLTQFNGRYLCSKRDAQRMTPLAQRYPKLLQLLWERLQGGLGVALLNVATVMYIRSRSPQKLPRERIARNAVIAQPGGSLAVAVGDYERPLLDYFVPQPIPEWHDFDHIVCTQIDDRFGTDLGAIQQIPNSITQLNQADPNHLVWLAPDDMSSFPIDSDYGIFQRLAPWFYRRALLAGMDVEATLEYVQTRLTQFLCCNEPAGDFRTSRKVYLPKFTHEYNAQKRASLVWGSWGEVPSKEVSPYITFLDKEEPGLTKGFIQSDEKRSTLAEYALHAIAEVEISPPTARRLITEMAFAKASMAAARYSLAQARLEPHLESVLQRVLNAYDFESEHCSGEHPQIPLREWAACYPSGAGGALR